jgi:hypothetical protein
VTDNVITPAVSIPPSAMRRMSWGAVIAGVVAVLSVQILLTVLGLAVGATALDPGQDSAKSIGIGAGIWIGISGLIALLIGGWVAARLAGVPDRGDGSLHGFITWGLATLVAAVMITTAAGNLMGGAFSSIAGPLKGRVSQMANQAMQNPDQAAQQAQNSAQQMQAQSQQLQQQAKQQIQQHGDQAANATSKGGWAAFIAMLLGAIAAILGGTAGSPKGVPTVTANVTRMRRTA